MENRSWVDQIRAIRNDRILSMQEHANEIGISLKTYRKILGEDAKDEKYSWSTLKLIEKYLNEQEQHGTL